MAAVKHPNLPELPEVTESGKSGTSRTSRSPYREREGFGKEYREWLVRVVVEAVRLFGVYFQKAEATIDNPIRRCFYRAPVRGDSYLN